MVHIHKADCCTVYTFNTSNELSAQPRALPWRETLHVLGRGRAALLQPLCPAAALPAASPHTPQRCCPPRNPALTEGREASLAEAAQATGASPCPPMVSSAALPQLSSCSWSAGGGCTYTHAQGWSLLPSFSAHPALASQRGRENAPVRAAVSGLLAAAGQGWRPRRQFKVL